MRKEEKKVFFFEKKKQKTLFNLNLQQPIISRRAASATDKSSLVLSFEKEHSFRLPQ
jgi:hypothetical protein